ncbi:hypothetical protein C8Q77DRAFT_751330 [Trametes polyzona]|nr:hypothetical protein C8Q77DRAFT_751330 [Trametes polyzona]
MFPPPYHFHHQAQAASPYLQVPGYSAHGRWTHHHPQPPMSPVGSTTSADEDEVPLAERRDRLLREERGNLRVQIPDNAEHGPRENASNTVMMCPHSPPPSYQDSVVALSRIQTAKRGPEVA